MKYSVPINWDLSLINRINPEYVAELYGKLAVDPIGGGRAGYYLHNVSKRKAKEYIKEIHRNKLKFNYLINASCLSNKEFTKNGYSEIRRFLDWINFIEADSVTVASPYLTQIIKKFYDFKISISAFARINSLERVRFWEDLGADSLTLSEIDLNRDFKKLRKIREYTKLNLRLIANNICLLHCPMESSHSNFSSHASQSFQKNITLLDYFRRFCHFKMLLNPEEIIKSGWIRPEDVKYYEDIGIDNLKLVDRRIDAQSILNIYNAYINREYKGNLIDLLPGFNKKNYTETKDIIRVLTKYLDPFANNIFKLKEAFKLVINTDLTIDNQKLESFLSYFVQNRCDFDCQICGYCGRVAKDVIKFDPALEEIIKDCKIFFDDLLSGRIYSYFKEKE